MNGERQASSGAAPTLLAFLSLALWIAILWLNVVTLSPAASLGATAGAAADDPVAVCEDTGRANLARVGGSHVRVTCRLVGEDIEATAQFRRWGSRMQVTARMPTRAKR